MLKLEFQSFASVNPDIILIFDEKESNFIIQLISTKSIVSCLYYRAKFHSK